MIVRLHPQLVAKLATSKRFKKEYVTHALLRSASNHNSSNVEKARACLYLLLVAIQLVILPRTARKVVFTKIASKFHMVVPQDSSESAV